MKPNTHPAYNQITITCACGSTRTVGSTLQENFRVEVCSNCHPLYTGKANLIDTAGRIDKFTARMKKAEELKAAAATKATA